MSLAQPLPPQNANRSSARRFSAENAEDSESNWSIRPNLHETPEKEKLPQLPLPHSGLNLKSALKITLVLVLAASYLTFCVIAHYRTIPIGGKGVMGLSFVHFTTVSGITTIAILITNVALWPIKSLVDEIRSEEFFRLLRIYPKGVPLDSVNAISVPTTGAFDIALATFHRLCSPLLTSTLVTTLLIAATSALAPAALTAASTISIDVVDHAFQIGAIPNSSYAEGSRFNSTRKVNITLFTLASAITWVENALNLTATYSVITSEDDPLGYIVAFPPGYNTTMQAQWTTDIIVFDPSCNWQSTNITGVLNVSSGDIFLGVTLPESNLDVVFLNNSFVVVGDGIGAKVSVPAALYNRSTMPIASDGSLVSDGSTVLIISQLTYSPFLEVPPLYKPSIDFSKVPTLQVSNGNILAFLLCRPHVSIQTRQVSTMGNGIFTLGQHQPSQGNLDLRQVNYLMGEMLFYSNFATNSGPLQDDVGTEMMVRLILGNNYRFWSNIPPAPLTNITTVYKQVMQSATKVFLSGAFGVANVTGVRFKEQVAFKSSLGHVIASAILFTLLTMGLVVAQFRKERDAFTLVEVAAALAGSDAPQKFVEMKQRAGAGERRTLRFVQSGKDSEAWIVLLGESTED